MIFPLARLSTRRMKFFVGAAFLTAAVPLAFGEPPGADDVEQIERRIRRQNEEDRQAVRALVERLTARLDEQRAQLAADEAKLRSIDVFVLRPDQELLALESQLERQSSGEPPRPSADSPYPNIGRGPASRTTLDVRSREVPPLPQAEVGPFELDRGAAEKPGRAVEARPLRQRVEQRRASTRALIADLLRAQALLRELGDDAAPPPPAARPAASPRLNPRNR